MAKGEVFRTREGRYRILVEQVIDGKVIDWILVERVSVATPDKFVAHTAATRRFVGKAVDWTGRTTDTGFEFTVVT